MIHLKDGSLIPDIMRVLAEEKAVRRAIIFCFEYPAMQRLAKEYPQVRKGMAGGKIGLPEGWASQGVVDKAVAAKCNCLAPEAGQVTPALVAAVPCGQAARVDVDRRRPAAHGAAPPHGSGWNRHQRAASIERHVGPDEKTRTIVRHSVFVGLGVTAALSSRAENTVGQAHRGPRQPNGVGPLVADRLTFAFAPSHGHYPC